MAKTTTSQSQHETPFIPFDPTAGLEAWRKMSDAFVARMETLHGEIGRVSERAAEQGRTVIEEAADLMKASIDYTVHLGDEWRKMALDATRRASTPTHD